MKPLNICSARTAIAIVFFGLYSLSANAFDNWLMMGDSIMSWVIGPDSQASALTANRIPTIVNISIMNLSKPGARISYLTKSTPDSYSSSRDGTIVGSSCISFTQCPYDTRFSAYLYKKMLTYFGNLYGAKGLIITLGRNDWGSSDLNQLNADYSELVAFAISNGLKVVCVGPIWDASETSSNNMSVIRFVIWGSCNSNGGTFINAYDAVPHNTALYYSYVNSSGQTIINNTHLNAAGHQQFTNWLVTNMKNLGFW